MIFISLLSHSNKDRIYKSNIQFKTEFSAFIKQLFIFFQMNNLKSSY